MTNISPQNQDAKAHPRHSVSAFVVNFNGGDRIIKCIQALLRQSLHLDEIIVVDNGSTDSSIREIKEKFPEVRMIELGTNRGLPAARNIGLKHAKTELVVSLDSDIYVSEDCLELLLQTYLTDCPAVVCPRIILYSRDTTVQCDGGDIHFVGTLSLRHGYQMVDDLPKRVSEVGGCVGACLLMDRERVLAAGGFDETYFFYFEDLEFSLRMRSFGYALFCNPNAIVYHDPRSGIPELSFRGTGTYPVRRAYLTMRHRLLTIFIHYKIQTILVLMPVLVLYELASFAVSLGRGWIAQWFRAWIWQVLNIRNILKKRRFVQINRVRRDRELLAGGPVPIAPGFIRSRLSGIAVRTLSAALNAYWSCAKYWIG